MRNTVTLTVKMIIEIPISDNLQIEDGTKTEINNQYRNYGLGVIREKLQGLDPTFTRVNLTKGGNND